MPIYVADFSYASLNVAETGNVDFNRKISIFLFFSYKITPCSRFWQRQDDNFRIFGKPDPTLAMTEKRIFLQAFLSLQLSILSFQNHSGQKRQIYNISLEITAAAGSTHVLKKISTLHFRLVCYLLTGIKISSATRLCIMEK